MKAGSTGTNERQRAQADALRQAMSALQQGQPANAERIAGDILKTSPGHPDATKVLAYALVMLQRPGEAVAPLERAARAGADPEIETQLAVALQQTGESDKALTWLKRAVKRTPPFLPAFLQLGSLLQALKRPDEAVEVLRQAAAMAPTIPELWTQLGFALTAMNDGAGAVDAFSRALAINPLFPAAVNGMTTTQMRAGHYAKAAELFKRVIAAHPNEASARVGLGICLLELGDTDAAYANLRAAVGNGVQPHSALKAIVTSSRGRFWLRPSRAAAFLKGEDA
jgi:Flp pilus assembly protein TadD